MRTHQLPQTTTERVSLAPFICGLQSFCTHKNNRSHSFFASFFYFTLSFSLHPTSSHPSLSLSLIPLSPSLSLTASLPLSLSPLSLPLTLYICRAYV